MNQVVLRNGQPTVADVPAPSPQPGFVLIANGASAISSGTERSAVSSGSGGSLPMRAIRNPDLVLKTLKHAREHGVRGTVELVRGAVVEDVPLGYSSAGIVLDTGGIPDFSVGQAVACAGAGRANHAEVVSVPGNLVAPVPDGVSLRDAAFTTLGAIALQGVRRTKPALGERVVVVGLGLLGLLTVQILRANGCRVLGVEPVPHRRALAEQLGAERALAPEDATQAAIDWSGGQGADAVIVCASAPSDAIVNDAIKMVRRKGRVVPVGLIGLGVDRAPLYQREADILISTSYGPGRYDPSYEEAGLDYPFAYVRWTENRNMEAFLHLLASGDVKVGPIVDLEVPAERAGEAYAAVNSQEPPLAAVLTYSVRDAPRREVVRISGSGGHAESGAVRVALVGAGSFVRGMHLPNLKRDANARVELVVSRRGDAATSVARQVGGARTATDWRAAVEDPDIDLVLVGTRHDTHAEISAAALRAGKAVFVEKPLGLTREEIDDVWAAGVANDRLAIGFNRTFAPLARKMAGYVRAESGPAHLVYRVNAPLAHDHWLNDPDQGGGRLRGEGCHMFDFANWLCGTPIRVLAAALPAPPDVASVESASVTIEYADGSVATVHYSGVGPGSMPKERIEVLCGGRSWVLEDFGALTSYGPESDQTETSDKQDKGHAALLSGVLQACLHGSPLEPGIGAAYAAQSVALAALESIAGARAVDVVSAPASSQEEP